MGQNWHFFNVSWRQHAHPQTWPHHKLGSIFFNKQPFLLRSLAFPYPSVELEGYLANPAPIGPIAEKGLLSLPDDVLYDLFKHEDLSSFDKTCLAVTCKKLLTIAAGHALAEWYTAAAPWIGDRVVCLGEYTTLDDVPEALLSPATKDQMRAALAKQYGEEDVPRHADSAMFSLFGDAEKCGILPGIHYHRRFLNKLSLPDRRLFVAAAAVRYPARDDWALCSISKREYVRASGLAALSGCPDDTPPFLPRCAVDFGTALFTRFCFSTDDSVAMPNERFKIHQGKWVGDKIIIDTIERATARTPGCVWKDVTEEVIADIKAIYQDCCDDDWEQELTKKRGAFQSWYFEWDDEDSLRDLVPPRDTA